MCNINVNFENELVIAVLSTDHNGQPLSRALVGSYVIIPKRYVESPFDLTDQEWLATKKMMATVKQHLDEKFKPNGYNLGWNVGQVAGQEATHVHLHIIPRFADEPLVGKGIRHWLKKDENIRPI